ncbi:hypothetical protein E3N88_32164 [Mikania micrantha]|uniref:Ubiquitin-like protease family profile domain-containing protein n=1 Tax=Mikania micrantha TaxID=192012 RepID=A0A5N6M7M5_9ASTR|nr:hypothetical protein E3N88_32164 [Mikania micrantha]
MLVLGGWNSLAAPDDYTFSFTITARSRHPTLLGYGQNRHMMVIKLGYDSDVCVGSAFTCASRLEDAFKAAKTMQMMPDDVIWRALLSACRVHENVGQCKTKRESKIHNEDDSTPGCGYIEIDGVVHEFLAADKLHPHIMEEAGRGIKKLSKAPGQAGGADDQEQDKQYRKAGKGHYQIDNSTRMPACDSNPMADANNLGRRKETGPCSPTYSWTWRRQKGKTCGPIQQTEKKHAPLEDVNNSIHSPQKLTKAAIIKVKEQAMNLARVNKLGIETPDSTGVSNEKKEVIDVQSSPLPKEKHRGGYQNVQLQGSTILNLSQPSFSLGMTQEVVEPVPNFQAGPTLKDKKQEAASFSHGIAQKVVEVDTPKSPVPLSAANALKGKKVDAPSFSLGMTQEFIEVDTPKSPVTISGQCVNASQPSQQIDEVIDIGSSPIPERIHEGKSERVNVSQPSFSFGMSQEGVQPLPTGKKIKKCDKKMKNVRAEEEAGTSDKKCNKKMKNVRVEEEAKTFDDGNLNECDATRKTKRLKFVSRDCKSPFFQREVVIKNRYTREEKAVWNLIFGGDKETKETQKIVWDTVFDTVNGVKTEIYFLRSLEPGREVYGDIIDCWATVLNDEEKLRSPESPHRLFCGHRTFMDWMFNKDDVNDDMRLVTLNKMMLHAVGGIKELQDLKPYDLVFFPILERKHFYAIVFELKNPAIYLLDNMQQGETVVTIKDDEDYSLKSIPYKVAHRVVYGKLQKKFECGFKKDKAKQKNQIIALRKKYASRILLSNVNVQKERVLKEAGLKCME